jgi:PAS domain S-box-containing protein
MQQGVSRKAIHDLSAKALAGVLEQSIDCVKLIGPDGDLLYVNDNGLRLMEIDAFEDVAGHRWTDHYPATIADAIMAAYRQALGTGIARFRAFCPTSKGRPRWWDVTVSPVAGEGDPPMGYLCISRDITESQAASEALEIVSSEVKHRLKNTYTIVASLLTAFARGDTALEAYAAAMTERLAGLSVAQSLFLSNTARCEIAHLVPALVKPFENPGCPVVIDERSGVIVDQGIADAIALVLGELSVNSAKHGALNHGGDIHVTSVAADGVLVITWIERARRAIRQRERDGGQGLKLMHRIVRNRGGSIVIDWHDDGLTVTLAFPHETAAELPTA